MVMKYKCPHREMVGIGPQISTWTKPKQALVMEVQSENDRPLILQNNQVLYGFWKFEWIRGSKWCKSLSLDLGTWPNLLCQISGSTRTETLQPLASEEKELIKLYCKSKKYNLLFCLASPVIFQHFWSWMIQRLG